MSKTTFIFSQKKYQRIRTSFSVSTGAETGVILPSEIELTSVKPENSAKLFRGIEVFRYKILAWIKENIFSNLYLLFAIGTLILLPQDKVEKRLTVHSLDKIEQLLKRFIDILSSGVGLLLCMPLFFVVGILIKLDSPGPIFFKQERVGMDRRRRSRRVLEIERSKEERKTERRQKDLYAKPFYLYKFRTMVMDAEKGCGPIWAKKDDPRITNIGKVLRKTRIDELPQLINVLKGEMSLVGPRPERYHFVRDLIHKVDGYSDRLKVKPGITGQAQVEKGYDSSVDDVKEKVHHDLNYIQGWSIIKDFRILLKTVLVVATGKGAC